MTTDRETGVGISNTGGAAFKQSDLVDQDGWVYAPDNVGTPLVPVVGDWRTQIQPHPTITNLTVTTKQRFNVVWVTQVEDGKASVNSTGFEINRGSEGFSYGNDTTPSQTLVNIAPGIDGVTIGSTVGDTAIIAEQGPFAIHTDPATFSDPTQPDGTETLVLPFDSVSQSFLHVFQITESQTTIENGVSIFIDAASDITGATIRTGNLLPDGADAIQNVSFDAFQVGDAQAAAIGQNDFTWEREYPVQQGVIHFGFIQSNKPLIIQGKTIATIFIPKFNREIHNVEIQTLFNLPLWTAKTFAVGDQIIEGGDTFPTTARIYECNTAGPQVTDFATNIALWDKVGAGGGGGSGDMLKSVYDPTAKNADAFDMGNMVETASEKVLTAAERAAIVANTSKVSNANHTGEVTGSTALTVHPTAISNKALVTALSGMTVLVLEAGVLKKVDAADFLGGAQPGLVQTDFKEVTTDVSTNSATFVTLLTSNITTGANDLIIEVSASLNKSGGGVPSANLRILIDGVPIRGTGVELTVNANSVSLQVKKAMTAAAHTVTLEWKVDTGTAQIQPVSMPDSDHCSMFIQEVRV